MPSKKLVTNAVLHTAKRLQKFCSARGWSFCFIGGLAVQQ